MSFIKDLLLSLALTVGAFSLDLLLESFSLGLLIYIYFLAVILAAWKMGFRGGVMTTALVIGAALLKINWVGTLRVSLIPPIIVFFLEGTLISFMAKKLKQHTRELEKSEERKDSFINMASHELKTPITSMKAYIQLRLRTLEKEPNRVTDLQTTIDHNKRLLGQVDRLTTLVNNMLDITRIGAKKLELEKTEFFVDDFVGECISDLGELINHHRIEYVPSGLTIYGDRYRLGQVLTNLITNAVKYSPNKDRVIVRCTKKGEYVTLSVQDFGKGIPKSEGDKIFDRWYRSRNADRDYPGLGLGLFISCEIVRAHGGTMWYKSKTGKGSTFYFQVAAHEKEDTIN